MIAELRRSDPAQLVALYGRGRATEQIAEVEVETDAAVRIDVGQGAPQRANLDLDPDLLQHFPPQALRDAFPTVAFPTRKFPASALVIAALPARDEHFRSVPEDAGGHFVEAHGHAHCALPGRDARFSSRSRNARVRAQASLAAAGR